jgi:hypothetical protein
MTMSTRVQIPSLVNTMSACSRKKLNMVEGNACNYFCPTWKPTFCAMATKVLWIASWVLVRLLPWAQCKRWIPIKLMGCVHTHRRIPIIERCGSPNHVWNIEEKTKENNWKVGKISWCKIHVLQITYKLTYKPIFLTQSLPTRFNNRLG